MGDQSLRSLLVVGMTLLVRKARSHPERANKWLTSLLECKPARVATVAMGNKTARIVWAVLIRRSLQPLCGGQRRKEQRVSKTCELIVHKSAAKAKTPRRMARAK